MKNQALKLLSIPLLAGAFCFSACGDKSEASAESVVEEIKIPEAPDAAMQFVLRELAEANGAVLWQAMPASYQADVNAIAQLAGTKIDPEIYDKVFATVGRVADVFDKQKEFVYNNSLVGDKADEEEVAKMRSSWPAIMQIVQALTSSSLSSAAGLQGFEGEAFCADTVSTVLAEMDALAKLRPESEEPLLADLKNAEVKYVEGLETEAVLEMSIPGQEVETRNFVKVENRWVPQDMADQWTTQMAEARVKLEAVDPDKMAKQKPQILSVFAMIDGVLTQIESAETQEQFDQALQGAMMPIMGLMMMGQGMGGGMAPSVPSAPMPSAPAMPVAPSAP